MNCVTARDLFAELLAEELAEPRAAELKAHVASCASCAAELELLERAAEGIGALEVTAVPAGFTDAVMGKLGPGPGLLERLVERWRKPALVAAGVGALGAAVMLRDKPAETARPPTPAGVETAPAARVPAEREASSAPALPPLTSTTVAAPAPAAPPPPEPRRVPGASGPHTETLDRGRTGQPADASQDGSLDRPLTENP